jgi:MFS family permease
MQRRSFLVTIRIGFNLNMLTLINTFRKMTRRSVSSLSSPSSSSSTSSSSSSPPQQRRIMMMTTIRRRSRDLTRQLQTFVSEQCLLLCCGPQNAAVLVLIVIASLDNADKQLLASSFSILERLLNWNVEELGYFSLVTNLSYALSLPFWGWCIHRLTTTTTSTMTTTSTTITKTSTTLKGRHENNNPLFRLLAYACGSWGVATIGIAVVTLLSTSASSSSSSSTWFYMQIILRSFNGIALGSIIPLSQSLLVEVTPSHLRGQAFGLLSVGEKLAGAISSSAIVYFAETRWQDVYYCLGVASIGMGMLALSMGRHSRNNNNKMSSSRTTSKKYDKKESDLILDETTIEDRGYEGNDQDQQQNQQQRQLPLREIISRIVRLPAFVCLVAQGLFGGTPWDMMSYLLMLMDWKGLSKDQIVTIQFTTGLSSMLGGWVGGVMGDVAAAASMSSSSSSWYGSSKSSSSSSKYNNTHSSTGRIILALISVVVGIPLYGLFIYNLHNFTWALIWSNLFHFWATWTPSGAIRPICADLTNGPSERAQIVALWIVLEKCSGAIFGAPLVGFLTNRMLKSGDESSTNDIGSMNEEDVTTNTKANALAFNLFLLSSVFWGVCAFFWFVMLVVMMRQQSSTSLKRVTGSSSSPQKTVEMQSLIE